MQKYGRVPLSSIVADPQQPRKLFASGEIAVLAEDIKKNGVHIPVIGFLEDQKFKIADGERRVRAAILAGLSELPAIMLPERPTKARLRMLQHSLDAQRVNLTWMERSDLVHEIQTETGLTVSELAVQLSISQSECTKLLGCQRLSSPVQDMVRGGVLESEKAYLLSQEPDSERQLALAQEAAILTRDQFSGKVKSKGLGAKAKRAAFPVPGSLTVVVSGREITLEQVIDGLAFLLKELRREMSHGLDILAAQRALKKKAKVAR